MQSLREVQVRCRQAFLAGDAAALSSLVSSREDEPHVGISVYQNNGRETFRRALQASYPVIADLVGGECFAGLSAKYLKAYPASEPDLQAFGEQFPEFLDRCYGNSAHCYLPDVARLELAAEQVLLRREPAPLDAGSLASMPASAMPGLRFIPSPAARLVTSGFPILAIWRMHYRDDWAPVSLDAGPSYVLVLRSADDAVLFELSRLEYDLAGRLLAGESIGNAFESLSNVSSAAALQGALAKLLSCRAFVDIN